MPSDYVVLTPALTDTVAIGGTSVLVADTTMGHVGGLIANPLTAKDQGIARAESLFVSLLGPIASLEINAVTGTIEVVAGQMFLVPPLTNVWVNAVSNGHKFTAFFSTPYVPEYPPGQVPGQPPSLGAPQGVPPFFPPTGVTGLIKDIPMYLYQEYSDDDDLQGYIKAVNGEQQNFVDTFNALNLPIYTGPIVQGALLDWVGQGVYGMPRPSLTTGTEILIGAINTWGCGITQIAELPLEYEEMIPAINMIRQIVPYPITSTNDDIYRRVLTWHFFKGDGRYFNARWLKRRVWRFCYGMNGTGPESCRSRQGDVPHEPKDTYPSIADTDQISVSLGVDDIAVIRFVLGKRNVIGGALPNMFGCNGFGPLTNTFGVTPFVPIPLNDLETTYTPYLPVPMMTVFQDLLKSGVLEVPWQINFRVTIG
jgi:hypothetical protein